METWTCAASAGHAFMRVERATAKNWLSASFVEQSMSYNVRYVFTCYHMLSGCVQETCWRKVSLLGEV